MTGMDPLVAVIIPSYNRVRVISRALHSVLHQTYQNLEVIIVDDGSTDNTRELVQSFTDSRLRYIRHETRMGAPAARNTGIEAAKAEFIAFQDSDDEWLCDKLEKQMEAFSRVGAEVGVVYTGFLGFRSNAATYYPLQDTDQLSGNLLERLLYGNFITTQAAVVRRECFLKAGLFDVDLPRLQDWELFIRIAQYYSFKCINEPLLVTFYSAESITADHSKYDIALRLILKKHQDIFANNKRLLLAYRIHLRLGKFQKPVKRLLASMPMLRYFIKKLYS